MDCFMEDEDMLQQDALVAMLSVFDVEMSSLCVSVSVLIFNVVYLGYVLYPWERKNVIVHASEET